MESLTYFGIKHIDVDIDMPNIGYLSYKITEKEFKTSYDFMQDLKHDKNTLEINLRNMPMVELVPKMISLTLTNDSSVRDWRSILLEIFNESELYDDNFLKSKIDLRYKIVKASNMMLTNSRVSPATDIIVNREDYESRIEEFDEISENFNIDVHVTDDLEHGSIILLSNRKEKHPMECFIVVENEKTGKFEVVYLGKSNPFIKIKL